MTTPRLPPVRGHLDQVDLFRVVTFAAVVAVHSTGFASSPDSVPGGAAGFVLHFTREAFFFLTGFVLVYAQGDRHLDVRRFLSRRLRLIGVPYVVWSVLYWAYHLVQTPAPWRRAGVDLLKDLVSGRAEYHLYFLVVSFQVYLAFPLLLALVRAARRHATALTAALLAYQLAVLAWLAYAPHPAGASAWLADQAYVLLPSYLLWVVLGALAAQDLARAQAWLWRRRRAVVLAGVMAVAAALALYLRAVHGGAAPNDAGAGAVLQPVTVLDSLGVLAMLAVLSCAWGAARDDHPTAVRALRWCSSASFGVYLVHPLVLDSLILVGLQGPVPRLLPQPAAAVVAWLLTLAGSVAVVAVLRRTPLSLPLTGRSRPGAPVRAATRPAVPVPAGGTR